MRVDEEVPHRRLAQQLVDAGHVAALAEPHAARPAAEVALVESARRCTWARSAAQLRSISGKKACVARGDDLEPAAVLQPPERAARGRLVAAPGVAQAAEAVAVHVREPVVLRLRPGALELLLGERDQVVEVLGVPLLQQIIGQHGMSGGDSESVSGMASVGDQPLEDLQERQVGVADGLVEPALLHDRRILRMADEGQVRVKDQREVSGRHPGERTVAGTFRSRRSSRLGSADEVSPRRYARDGRSAMSRTGIGLLVWSMATSAVVAQDLADGGTSDGRVVWLRADRGVVKSFSNLVFGWTDSSGHGASLTCWAPESYPEYSEVELNGRPALRFDGNDWLYGVGMPTGSYTKVAVCRIDDDSFANNVVSSVSHHALWFGASRRARMFHSGDFVTSARDVALHEPVTLVATYDAASGLGRLYQDGLLVGSGTAASGNWDGSLLLGSFGFGNFLKGAIAEVMVYDRVLGVDELGVLNDYLRRRYVDAPAARVHWIDVPRPGQVLQRDLNSEAAARVQGRLESPGFTDITLEIVRDGVPWYSKTKPLIYGTNGHAPFVFAPTILAGKHDHELSVYVQNATASELVLRIPAVTAGDVYVVNGQSNAQASDYYGEGLANDSQSHWLRSFGTASIYGATEFDLHWDRADGESAFNHGSVGQWALRMGETIVHREEMPVALLNGAVGGTSIWQHQRNDADPFDLSTIFGRLHRRIVESGAADSFRALLWYQGESDAGDPNGWYAGWLSLRADWAAEYPALDHVYVVQIRNDCGSGGQAVQEIQRELQDLEPDVTVMSTTAVPAHDGCHFLYLGYRDLGEKMGRLLRRDFFGSTDVQQIDPPNPLSASWAGAGHRKIVITFRDDDDPLVVEPGAEANFTTELGEHPIEATVSGNTVTLRWTTRVLGSTISYVGHPQDGPWFRNARGVGALCFQGLPVQ